MSPNLMIVDDNPNNLKVLMAILSQQGFRVRAFLNGASALKALQKELPELILLDINMPQMDGYEVCQTLKTDPRTAEIPVLFLSALDDTSDKVKGFEVGGVDYITKPFEATELLARIRTHIELKRARDTLKDQNQFLKQLIHVKNEFLGMVSHDLQSPINRILLFSRYMEEQDISDAKARNLAQMINKAGQQMFQLVVNLLDLNQLEQEEVLIQPAWFDGVDFLNEVIKDVQDVFQRKAQRLVSHFPQAPCMIETDPLRLRQIVDNLLSNASKFSPSGSEIQLRLDFTETQIVIQVQDQGPGLTPEDQTRLFQRFAKLSARPTGGEASTGLGLSIVKQLVNVLQGEIGCFSEEGQGTRFVLTLPVQMTLSEQERA